MAGFAFFLALLFAGLRATAASLTKAAFFRSPVVSLKRRVPLRRKDNIVAAIECLGIIAIPQCNMLYRGHLC